MTLAGTPPQIQYGGIDFDTTAPAATVVPLPIVTPESKVTFEPIQTVLLYYYIMIISLGLVGFGNIRYELTNYSCVITNMNCQPLSHRTIAIADKLCIKCRNVGLWSDADIISKKNVLWV